MIEFIGAGTPLSQECISGIADSTGVGLAELWAVISVETTGCGFLPDRRPKILFERHVFRRLTDGRFDGDDPDISQPTAGGYGPAGAHQYDRLNAAMQLDAPAALRSASWGLAQIMGENCALAGYPQVEDMVTAIIASEDAQLLAMAKFLDSTGLTGALKTHDWPGFARRYNGPNYAANSYDGLLEHFYERYSAGPLPDLAIRCIQMQLTYKGYPVGGIDGVVGTKTRLAIAAFQKAAGLPATGAADASLSDALGC
jgi:hypothetical protein